jgi:hypothetical protein
MSFSSSFRSFNRPKRVLRHEIGSSALPQSFVVDLYSAASMPDYTNMRKEIVVGLAIACVALTAVTLYVSKQLTAQQELARFEASAKMSAELVAKEWEARYRELEQSYAEMLAQRTPSTVSLTSAAKKIESKSESRPIERSYPGGFDNAISELVPRRGSPRRGGNGELIRYLKLSEADADKFMQILTDDQQRFREALSRNGGNPLDSQAADSMRSETERELRDLLGEEGYREYQDYRRYAVEHQRINQLNSRLESSGEGALSADQHQQLLATMKEERNRVPQPAASQYGSRTEFSTAMDQWRDNYDARVKQRATTILSPEQLTTFRTLRGPGRRPSGRNQE